MNTLELFRAIDFSLLQKWLEEKQQEDLRLEFKNFAMGGSISQGDKVNFAKAISGFANSDGGIVVWGVDGRKDDRGIDCAQALNPMANASKILSDIKSIEGAATVPTVDGVEHRFIPSKLGELFIGFIATYVPRSERGPHMAKLTEDRYYKRSGDSFYKMEHFDIADMFGARRRPALALDVSSAFSGVEDQMIATLFCGTPERLSQNSIVFSPRYRTQIFVMLQGR